MNKYKYSITGRNLILKLRPIFEETMARKKEWLGKTGKACDYCLLRYPISCIGKKENNEKIKCNAENFFISPAMDFLVILKKERF